MARGGRWHLPAGLFECGPGGELVVPWCVCQELHAHNPSLPLFARNHGFFKLKGFNLEIFKKTKAVLSAGAAAVLLLR